MGRYKDGQYGIRYVLVDGQYACGEKLMGYCKAHKGLVTKPIENLHSCRCRESDGSMCRHYIRFERYDYTYESALTGDEFRESLGKKGVRKGERKKRESERTERKVPDKPCEYSEERKKRISQKERCQRCFWKKMFGRLAENTFCASHKNDGS